LKGLLALFARYAAHPDPLAAAANTIALLVGLDQPFYPLTLYWVTGANGGASFLAMLSMPLFLAVPAVMRCSSRMGRVALIVVGVANTLFCAKLLGQASGVELFLGPCLLLAALLFRQSEQWLSFGLIAVVFAALVGFHDRYGAAYLSWSAQEYEALVRANALSVAMLTVFVGVSVGRARTADGATAAARASR